MEISSKGRYMNPFTDFAFKKLFGTEVNKDLLIDFLNELIHDQGRITDLQYKKNEQLGIRDSDRRAFFDIYCENEHGDRFIVEMQQAYQSNFKDRNLYYATFPLQEQAERGDWDFSLSAVYSIGIMNFVFPETKHDLDHFRHEIKLMDIDKNTTFSNKLTFIYLEMPKFNKTIEELENHFDKWMYVLKNLPLLQNRPYQLQEKIFDNLFKAADISHFTLKEMDTYEESLKNLRDWNNVMAYAKEEARKEGLKEGREEGLEKGKEEGKAEGVQNEKQEIARKCLQKSMPIEDIAELTDLSIEQINRLRL